VLHVERNRRFGHNFKALRIPEATQLQKSRGLNLRRVGPGNMMPSALSIPYAIFSEPNFSVTVSSGSTLIAISGAEGPDDRQEKYFDADGAAVDAPLLQRIIFIAWCE
jgi:hypothetical protein